MKYTIQKFFKNDPHISQLFGVNAAYYKQFGFAAHEGVDYATATGTELFAPFDGIVLRDTDNPADDPANAAYGIKLVLWDPIQKIAIWFCHLKDNNVSEGQRVNAGQLIGHTDNTGNSTGPHCHVNFCETSPTGVRLNLDNGYKGFLNLLDFCTIKEFPQPIVHPTPVEIPQQPVPDINSTQTANTASTSSSATTIKPSSSELQTSQSQYPVVVVTKKDYNSLKWVKDIFIQFANIVISVLKDKLGRKESVNLVKKSP